MHQRAPWAAGLILGLALASGCGDDEGSNANPDGGAGTGGNGADGGTTTDGGGRGGRAGSGGREAGGPAFPIDPETGLPVGFTPSEVGAYKLGDRIQAGSSPGPQTTDCGSVITAVVRDFKRGDRQGGHPDFQMFEGDGLDGIVQNTLGQDQKPVYAHGDNPTRDPQDGNAQHTTNGTNFRQWFISNESVNQTYRIYFFLEQQSSGSTFVFDDRSFFPLDGAGFGDEGLSDGSGTRHNYLFTTEVHTRFRYKGGETFRFVGDDDLWVFINGKLAIDLGGMHASLADEVRLDASAAALGISTGNEYSLDLFHAERHTTASNFRIETNLEFVDCGTVVDDPVE